MLEIVTIEVTPIQQNCRILFDSENHLATIVDPGGDVDLVIDCLKKNNLQAEAIWLTHSHYDHCGGVASLQSKIPLPLFGHQAGQIFRQTVDFSASQFGGRAKNMTNCPEPDRYLEEGDIINVGEHQFSVYFTPGHAPDHLVFYNQQNHILIAGDTVFRQSIGRTDLPGGNYQLLINSIRNKILVLPDQTDILSGHGPNTTVGYEKLNNQYLR